MTSTTDDSLPLYDPNAPIACSIQTDDLPDHISVLDQIRQAANDVSRTAHGVRITLPPSPGHRTLLQRFVEVESRCCPFWGIELQEGDDLVLRWDGPPETSDFMDRLVDHLRGDAPLGALVGAIMRW